MSNEKTTKDIQRIFKIFKNSRGAVRPHFILTGPSGSGKSHQIGLIAATLDIRMFEINAAQLTKEGTSGNSLSKALVPLLQYGGMPVICFVDEFDKMFISGNSNDNLAHETTNGVQNEFLKVLEGETTSVFGDYGKYLQAQCDNVLFVFAGAFNGEENISLDRLRELGIKTEFLGRVGLCYGMEKMTLADMAQVLEKSELLDHYLKLFPETDRKQVSELIMAAVEANYEKNTIGVRILNTLVHQYFINGGELMPKQVKETTFQTTMSLKDDDGQAPAKKNQH